MQNNKTHTEKSSNNSKLSRPDNLFFSKNFSCDENVNIALKSSSSEEDSSPTELNLNHCKKVIDKPTLVKRLTMGLLRMSEESRPLVKQRSSPSSPSKRNYFYHYINAGIYDVDNRFGDSCRQSLTSVKLDGSESHPKNTIEFDFKKNLIRETSSATCSPKKFLLSSFKRTDSLNANNLDDEEDFELKEASWFQTSGLPHEISLEVLAQQSPGAFLVRKSATKPGCFALSVRVPSPGPKVAHYLILKTSRGYKIKGFPKEFSTLRALITHHSVMKELLPVPLSLPRPQNIPRKCKNIDDYDTYSTLMDLKSIFSDLDVNT